MNYNTFWKNSRMIAKNLELKIRVERRLEHNSNLAFVVEQRYWFLSYKRKTSQQRDLSI